MAFGTGYLSALVFLDLLPSIQFRASWILAGVILVFVFDRFISPYLNFLNTGSEQCSHHHHDLAPGAGGIASGLKLSRENHSHRHHHSHPLLDTAAACSTVGCLTFCALFDGVAIRTTFMTSSILGQKVLVGQIFHLIPESFIVFGVALAAGATVWRSLMSLGVVLFALALGLSAPGIFEKWQDFLLPISAGILIYITFSQLLPISAAGKRGALFAILGGLLFFIIYHF